MFDALRETYFWMRLYYVYRQNAASIERWQNARLRSLIQIAATTVPFYRDQFATAKITPAQLRTIADLPLIPIFDKQSIIKEPFESYVNHDHPTDPKQFKKTSGTTGTPLTVLMSKARMGRVYNDFVSYRFMLNGLKTPQSLLNVKVSRIEIYGWDAPNRQFNSLADFRIDPEKILRRIESFNPEIITSYPSTLMDLARTISDSGVGTLIRPRYAVSYGETLHPQARAFIAKSFDCEVFDRYGSTEIGGIALECERHDGMHVSSESVVAEIVDEHGQPLPDRARGRVILTDLLNDDMPFIRYDTGDYGILTHERCACGLETPRIWIEGRNAGALTFNGNAIHQLEFDGALEGFMYAIVQYQIVKKSEREVRVRVVPGVSFDDSTIQKIEKSLQQILGSLITINIDIMKKIPPTARFKSQLVVDESPPIA